MLRLGNFFYFSIKFKNMNFTVSNINKFLLLKLPSAYFTGIRMREITDEKAEITVTHRWINQNPFRSMYFGVQAMAAELSTGVLVMKNIQDSKKRISMLVTHQQGTFTKKATGKIRFVCEEGSLIKDVISKAIATGEGQTLVLHATGWNENQEVVSTFEFHWGLKVK